jgi:hypothetical protein
MSVNESQAQDSSRTLKFAVDGAQDRVEKIENANVFAAKMGERVVDVAFSEGYVSLRSSKSNSNDLDASKGPASGEDKLKSASEIVNIALARHLEGVTLESMSDDSRRGSPKASPKISLESRHNDEPQRPTPPRTPTPLRGNLESQSQQSITQSLALPFSDLVMLVCFRSTPEIGQPAFPFNGAVFPLHFGCTVVGRGKLQCLQLGSDKLIEIPHNSVSKRHAKIGNFARHSLYPTLYVILYFAEVSPDGIIGITDMNSTNGTCVGSSIESIMNSATKLEQDVAVSVSGGDYVSFGVCICRIIPERAQTSRPLNTEKILQFEPSAFALDQLRILKITMVSHICVFSKRTNFD